MKILAIESSCDETAVALLNNNEVLNNVIYTQEIHKKYGGVVPELASRAHIDKISVLTKECINSTNTTFEEIDAIAVTSEPGLMGALIVGSSFAKGLSIKYNIPVIPINHIEGHIYSGCIENTNLDFPFISLVVSGGHTSLFLVESFTKYETIGMTKDDAAGEAFDKIDKLLGLSYPGGPIIDQYAKKGKPDKYDFPRSMIHSDNFDFSFSGLKTSVRYFVNKNFDIPIREDDLNDLCASVQKAIVDVLVAKAVKASKKYIIKSIVIGGGVSANSLLREEFSKLENNDFKVVLPDMEYCIDNAAMIGFLAGKKLEESKNLEDFYDLEFKVSSRPSRAAR